MVDHEEVLLPQNLRVADLIATTARVTLKDTLRVLVALDAVAYAFDTDLGTMLDQCDYEPCRPTPEEIAACEQAFFDMRREDHMRAYLVEPRLRLIKSLT